MISLIVGSKGSGKTKKLLACVEQALATSKGYVVCVEKGEALRHEISYKARLVSTDKYGVSGYDELFALLVGLWAGNHDVTDILVDATFRICPREYEAFADFLGRLSAFSEMSDVRFVFTASTDIDSIPARALEYVTVI
ncbi:MAG: hypothetical protein K6G90_11245 [Clostridia bacterium]|nr:hypothetical protein [Clostridia bacterium]